MFRKWIIDTFFRWSSGSSDERLAHLLHRFSLVEADSAWQMIQAMNHVEDKEYRSDLFNNALEEVHHAYLFQNSAVQYTTTSFVDHYHKRKEILGKDKELLDFKIEHYLGEKDVYEQFLNYSRAVPKEDVKELFLEIRGDEEEHQRKAREKLLEELGSEARLRGKIRRVRLSGLWEGWINLGKWMGNLTFTLVLSVFYVIGECCLASIASTK